MLSSSLVCMQNKSIYILYTLDIDIIWCCIQLMTLIRICDLNVIHFVVQAECCLHS